MLNLVLWETQQKLLKEIQIWNCVSDRKYGGSMPGSAPAWTANPPDRNWKSPTFTPDRIFRSASSPMVATNLNSTWSNRIRAGTATHATTERRILRSRRSRPVLLVHFPILKVRGL